jgi:trans-aconitate methyltransferase
VSDLERLIEELAEKSALAAELLQAEEAGRHEALQELAERQAEAVAELLRMQSGDPA